MARHEARALAVVLSTLVGGIALAGDAAELSGDAIDACANAQSRTDAARVLEAQGFRRIEIGDADAIFDLSRAPRLFLGAASDAADGLDDSEAAANRTMFDKEYGSRAKKARLSVLSGRDYPELIGPDANTYVIVSEGLVPSRGGFATTCEIFAADAPGIAEIHEDLPPANRGAFNEKWIDERADTLALQDGGLGMSLRLDGAAFEGLFHAPLLPRYILTVIARPASG